MSVRHATIALLPFENLSGTPEDARMGVGFVQDLISELARFPSVGVIAAHSSFAMESAGLDEAGIGKRLGADYLLKGSVRRSESAVRISVQLVQLSTGQHTWGERYDVPASDILEVQDEIAAKVANALTQQIDLTVLRATRRRQITNLAAYECWLRGMECLQRGTSEADEEARTFFEQALKLDPQYAQAQAGVSLSHFNEWSCMAWDCWEKKETLAYDCARRAELLDPEDPLVQVILAKIEQYRRDHQSAEARYRRALNLAPNNATLLIQLSVGFALLGHAELAAECGERALTLNPLCPSWYYYYASIPYFTSRDYERAMELGLKTPTIVTDGPAYLAAACARLAKPERAEFHLAEFRKIFAERITPGRAPARGEMMQWLVHVNPFRNSEDLSHFTESLELAGLERNCAPPSQPSNPVAWPISNIFRKDGELWTVSFDHEVAYVGEVRGLHDLARLLSNPAEEIHCVSLAGQVADAGRGTEVLDDQARRAYRARLRELEAEIAEAERQNDPGRVEQLEEEKEQLLAEMRKATGLGGRSRKIGDTTERARSAVTWRIRHAIKKLEPVHPRLARHLGNSIKTGVFCSYTPERDTQWFV
jgi:TolB-like protein/tetratricopeptide (TPR) repeat protein